MTHVRTFSRAFRFRNVFGPNFDWLTGLSMSSVIGQGGFGFTTCTKLKTVLRGNNDGLYMVVCVFVKRAYVAMIKALLRYCLQ